MQLQRNRIAVVIPSHLVEENPQEVLYFAGKVAAKRGLMITNLVEVGRNANDFVQNTLTAVFDVKRWLRPLKANSYTFN